MSTYPRGSEWRKWDLHVHTPKSIIQHFGGENKASWDAFITKLASLPAEVKVIGITDYLFCDGYEHLLTRRSEIPNIELLIPNIEFRLDTFSGTANNTKRHNFHVLFDPNVKVQDIKEQLLNCLSTGYKIQDKAKWQRTPTISSLEELGKQIKLAAPEGNTVHSKSDLEVGFDNITYKREDIEELLEKDCFKGQFVTAIGYSEWDQAKWDQSAATKNTKIKTLREGKKADVILILGIATDELVYDNLQLLNKGLDEKQKETRAFETVKIKYQQQKQTAMSVESSIKALENEISKITTESAAEMVIHEKDRMTNYCQYFKLLGEEKKKMEELYNPLQKSLLGGTDTDKKLVFDAKINYQLDMHSKSGLDIIDRTRKGNFKELNSLRVKLSAFWDECVRQDFIDTGIEAEINKLLEAFTNFDSKPILINEQLRENYTLEDFFNWQFDPTKFEIVSSIKFDDTDLYVLSPGQKGIILLMLYLEIDKGDYRPLIIDQPEENLDNLSVYKDLIDYFRDRKQYRQIIIVTHNPNLVVNTDSEQIIIASYDGKQIPRLNYVSGSLENQAEHIPNTPIEQLDNGIIEQVCNILEGGEPAFGKRKKKYQISIKSQI